MPSKAIGKRVIKEVTEAFPTTSEFKTDLSANYYTVIKFEGPVNISYDLSQSIIYCVAKSATIYNSGGYKTDLNVS